MLAKKCLTMWPEGNLKAKKPDGKEKEPKCITFLNSFFFFKPIMIFIYLFIYLFSLVPVS